MHTTTIHHHRAATFTARPRDHRTGIRQIAAGVAAAVISMILFFVAAGSGSTDTTPTTPAGPSSSIEALAAQ